MFIITNIYFVHTTHRYVLISPCFKTTKSFLDPLKLLKLISQVVVFPFRTKLLKIVVYCQWFVLFYHVLFNQKSIRLFLSKPLLTFSLMFRWKVCSHLTGPMIASDTVELLFPGNSFLLEFWGIPFLALSSLVAIPTQSPLLIRICPFSNLGVAWVSALDVFSFLSRVVP